jgi:sugar lactone lactonase YvrE
VERRIATVLTGMTISNGIQWNSDGITVYYGDTGESRVDVFDFDAARSAFLARCPFVSIEEVLGAPDGWRPQIGGHKCRRVHFRRSGRKRLVHHDITTPDRP